MESIRRLAKISGLSRLNLLVMLGYIISLMFVDSRPFGFAQGRLFAGMTGGYVSFKSGNYFWRRHGLIGGVLIFSSL